MKLLFYTYFFFASCCATHPQILDRSWSELVQNNNASWFGSMEAKQVAENVLLLQKNIGGWPKNVQPQALSEADKTKFESQKRDSKGNPSPAIKTAVDAAFTWFDALSEIGEERRNGYKWYTDRPEEVLGSYHKWKKKVEIQKDPKKKVDIYNLVVSQDGSGDFTSIQEAINSAKGFPDKRVTIKVKNGIYKEKVEVYEWNNRMSIIGEDKEKTVITYDDYFDQLDLGRNSTFHTPTFLVQGNDFYAANLTIENTAGEVGQAVALAVNADRVLIENCTITGNQDTLYTTGEGFKQYYRDCYIEGTTDFIFGRATALFQDCVIHSKSDSYITAASTPKGMDFGYVFKDCKLTGDEGLSKVYLGRPWRTYAQTVFINCIMGGHIIPEGWDNWGNAEAEKEALYAEYACSGPGYLPEQRVSWSRQLKKSEARRYTVQNILDDERFYPKNWYDQFEK